MLFYYVTTSCKSNPDLLCTSTDTSLRQPFCANLHFTVVLQCSWSGLLFYFTPVTRAALNTDALLSVQK